MNYFIKVCGITNLDDLNFISISGADAIGFNLYEKSKRHINFQDAKKMAKILPENIKVFLIFVNHKADFVTKCLLEMPYAIPQFHGDESKDYCESFGRDYVKAIRIKSDTDLEKINHDFKSAKMLIFDSYDEKEYGGTGQTFDLKLLEGKVKIPFLAAGGIDESNFEKALLSEYCMGLDICSSVEEVPGVKNHFKVTNLIEKVRSFNV
jgi:phosphoribosylanthranilate isomerase